MKAYETKAILPTSTLLPEILPTCYISIRATDLSPPAPTSQLPGGAVRGLLAGLDQTGQRQWRFHSEALGSQHGAAQAHLQRRETAGGEDGETPGEKKMAGENHGVWGINMGTNSS